MKMKIFKKIKGTYIVIYEGECYRHKLKDVKTDCRMIVCDDSDISTVWKRRKGMFKLLSVLVRDPQKQNYIFEIRPNKKILVSDPIQAQEQVTVSLYSVSLILAMNRDKETARTQIQEIVTRIIIETLMKRR